MFIRPLICSPSPRDLPQFKEEQNTIPCDKLLVKYHHAKRAYKIMHSYFIDHKEYTHMIIHPDDLIANNTHYEALKQDIEEHDYPVLSGVCNVTAVGGRANLLAVSNDLPALVRRKRRHIFIPMKRDLNGIFRVLWSGFPFMWVRRDVLEKIQFEDDSEWNPDDPNHGWSFDDTFCYRCMTFDIPIHADFRVFMQHLKHNHKLPGFTINTGSEKPKVIQQLVCTGNQEQDITKYCHERYLTKEDWTPYPHLNSTTGRLDMV